MNTKAFPTLVKREIWEHRQFWLAPAVAAAVMLLFYALSLIAGLTLSHVSLNWHGGYFGDIGDLANVTADDRHKLIAGGTLGTAMPLLLLMGVLMVFYCLNALYEERQDRSILFWKSLPVSDLATVLSKLATVLIAAPLLTLVVIAVTNTIGLFFTASALGLAGIKGWYMMFNPLPMIGVWLSLLEALFFAMLAALPFAAWFLLASSWAKRAPFLWAFLPPVILGWLEWWLLDTTYVFDTIGRQSGLIAAQFQTADMHVVVNGGSQLAVFQNLPEHLGLFAAPQFWVGSVLGLAFLGGAIWLRRYRDDT